MIIDNTMTSVVDFYAYDTPHQDYLPSIPNEEP